MRYFKNVVAFVMVISFAATLPAQQTLKPKPLAQKLSTLPHFIGDSAALDTFLARNLKYPELERDNDIQGRVVTRFMVSETGDITDVEVLRKVSVGIDREAIRVVKLMPKWKPATYNGKPVAMYYYLPIVFKLEREK